MAYITDWTCTKCKKSQHSSVPKNRVCHDCKTKEEDRKRREYFGSLDALTIEERIRNIEEYIYEHKNSYHPGRPLRF
jgi:hypothetical protein